MIVVVGMPAWRTTEPGGADGRAVRIARSAVREGATVQVVGKAGEDPHGDALLLDLARAGIGHAAVLREAGRPTATIRQAPERADEETPPEIDGGHELEPADVELALRYLTDFRVLVVADPLPEVAARVAADAAGYVGAHLVRVVEPGAPADDRENATLLAAPSAADDAGFADLVGRYAAAIDRGMDPAAAFDRAAAAVGLET